MTKHAIISTANKTNLVEFAAELISHQYSIIATGGTANYLQSRGVPVTEVSDFTHFPEILDGRVKTLHPKIHAGILARDTLDDDTLLEHAIPKIDLVVVNLYPFVQVTQDASCTEADAIEHIDIGGVTLLRAGAKNFNRVTVVTDPMDYTPLLTELKEMGTISLKTRRQLAQKAFMHTAQYDQCIANYFGAEACTLLPLYTQHPLRYGENPHQEASYFTTTLPPFAPAVAFDVLQGKALSYNNLLDADAAFQAVAPFEAAPTCAIIKHLTPCGLATGENQLEAYQRALAGDPVSAFGGILILNRPLDATVCKTILSQLFLEVLLAPDFEAAALVLLKSKPNLRVIRYRKHPHMKATTWQLHSICSGILAQTPEQHALDFKSLRVVTQRKPSPQEWEDLKFAWNVVRAVKSNAVVFAKNGMTLGIGTGQTSRVFSVEIAARKAAACQHDLQGAVLASDAFFPFADGLELAIQQKITAVIQPGGSVRDSEVIAAADAAHIAMVFTGVRCFKH